MRGSSLDVGHRMIAVLKHYPAWDNISLGRDNFHDASFIFPHFLQWDNFFQD